MWSSTQFKQDKKRSKSAPTSVCAVFNTMHTYTDTQSISICEKIFSDSSVTQMVIGKFGYQRKIFPGVFVIHLVVAKRILRKKILRDTVFSKLVNGKRCQRKYSLFEEIFCCAFVTKLIISKSSMYHGFTVSLVNI